MGILKECVSEALDYTVSNWPLFVKANILIDRSNHACLADFGLLTIASNTTNVTSSNSFQEGGTYRWMAPELFYPKKFGLKNSRPTKSSDCYALGMVAYEVLSGNVPFHHHGHYAVVFKVSEGGRPKRPPGARGLWFGDDIWDLLQHCWGPCPDDRPRVKDVLRRLEDASRSWTPPPQTVVNPPTETPPMRNLESSTEESTDEYEVSSASPMVSPQPSQGLGLEGNPDENIICPSVYHGPTLSDDALGHCTLGTVTKSLGGSGGSEQIMGKVSWFVLLDGSWW